MVNSQLLSVLLFCLLVGGSIATGSKHEQIKKSVAVLGDRGYAIIHESSVRTRVFLVLDEDQLELEARSGDLVRCRRGIPAKMLNRLMLEATIASEANLKMEVPRILQSKNGRLESFDILLKRCRSLQLHHIRAKRSTNSERSRYTIFPGTKWCGNGNVAEHEDDFGSEIAPDRCCHRHDRCHKHIVGYETKYGITNPGPFTLNHCTCDDEFQVCLRSAGTTVANEIGRWFFNLLKTKCFIVEEQFGCTEWYITNVWCKKYGYSKKAVMYAPQPWN